MSIDYTGTIFETENDQGGMAPVVPLVMLPVYESTATPEERQKTLEWMAEQVRVIHEQEKIGTPIQHVKIRCGCNKFVGWMFMYRCLHCGVWFCKECAEKHFGKRVPEPFAGVAR